MLRHLPKFFPALHLSEIHEWLWSWHYSFCKIKWLMFRLYHLFTSKVCVILWPADILFISLISLKHHTLASFYQHLLQQDGSFSIILSSLWLSCGHGGDHSVSDTRSSLISRSERVQITWTRLPSELCFFLIIQAGFPAFIMFRE